MPFNIPTIIILITLFVIYMIFLVFDLFGRNEKYGYLAYIIAVIPVNYFWGMGGDPLIAYIILFILWIATILRDTIGVYRKKEKEINEIFLYLALGVLIQLIISAIIPETNTSLQNPYTEKFWFFWLPNVHSAMYAGTPIALGFQIVATILIFLVIIPLILDIKDEEIPLPIVFLFVAIFIAPFLYLSYLWVPDPVTFWTLTLLFCVVLFIVLLLITRSGQETK